MWCFSRVTVSTISSLPSCLCWCGGEFISTGCLSSNYVREVLQLIMPYSDRIRRFILYHGTEITRLWQVCLFLFFLQYTHPNQLCRSSVNQWLGSDREACLASVWTLFLHKREIMLFQTIIIRKIDSDCFLIALYLISIVVHMHPALLQGRSQNGMPARFELAASRAADWCINQLPPLRMWR